MGFYGIPIDCVLEAFSHKPTKNARLTKQLTRQINQEVDKKKNINTKNYINKQRMQKKMLNYTFFKNPKF